MMMRRPPLNHPMKAVLGVSGGLALSGMLLSAIGTMTHRKVLLYIAVGLWVLGFLVANVPLAGMGIYRLWNRLRARTNRPR